MGVDEVPFPVFQKEPRRPTLRTWVTRPALHVFRKLLPRGARDRFDKWLSSRSRRHHALLSYSSRKAALRDLVAACRARTVRITSPLLLISQAQRSGGTLLSQLFDAHPQCHAHPHELHIGDPDKTRWPSVDLAEGDPERWFRLLFERPTVLHYRFGYRKSHLAERHPFLLSPYLQRAVFIDQCRRYPPSSQRDVLDVYMTSYFNGWLDNRNLFGEKKYVTAFVPRLAIREDDVARFFGVYPDGRLIQLVRNPDSWFASTRALLRRNGQEWTDERILSVWMDVGRGILRNSRHHPDRVLAYRFETLVERTEDVLRDLCGQVQLEFHECLLKPTFNEYPLKPNSSFEIAEGEGVRPEVLDRSRMLEAPIREWVYAQAGDLHEQLLAMVRL